MRRGLDDRLGAAYDLVREGSFVADVGCDHGQLICALVGSGKCPGGIAADVRKGPLAAAERNIRRLGLEDRIETTLTDGIRELPGERIGDVVIAGMGGELILDILRAGPWAFRPDKRLTLQPMTRADALRRGLYAMGFAILEERAAVSRRHCYTVMQAAYTGEIREIDGLFAETGLLLQQDDPASRAYLLRVQTRLERRVQGLAAGGGENAEIRELQKLVESLRERTEKHVSSEGLL